MDDVRQRGTTTTNQLTSNAHAGSAAVAEHRSSASEFPKSVKNRLKISSSWGASIIYFISFLDLLAVSMLTPLIRQQTLSMGASYTVAGLIGSIYGVFQMLSGPLIGDWSDRSGRNRVLLITTLVTSIGYFVFSVSSSFVLLFLSRIICGSFKHTQTLCKAYLADLRSVEEQKAPPESQKPAKHSVKNFGNFMTVSTCGFVLGPLLGGMLAEYEHGFQIVAVVTALMFLTVGVIVKVLLPQVGIREPANKKNIKLVKLATGEIFRSHWDVFLLQAFMSLSVLVVRTNYVQYVQEQFGLSFRWAGYLTSYQAMTSVIGSACVSYPVQRYYRNNFKLVLHSTVLTGIGVLGATFTDSFPMYIFFLSVISFATPFGRMAHMVQLTDRSHSEHHHGALMGTSQSVASLCRSSSALIAGASQDYSKSGPETVSVMCIVFAVSQIVTMYS